MFQLRTALLQVRVRIEFPQPKGSVRRVREFVSYPNLFDNREKAAVVNADAP